MTIYSPIERGTLRQRKQGRGSDAPQTDASSDLRTHDGADDNNRQRNDAHGPDGSEIKPNSISGTVKEWLEELRSLIVGVCAIITLALLLWHFDGKVAPDFGPGLDLDMVMIALMTILRVAIGSIVESCVSQGAWIWFSKSHQIRTGQRARLKDYKLFDEASRGLLGSCALIWRLKGMHLTCLGALIIIVTHGFETSQQMFVLIAQISLFELMTVSTRLKRMKTTALKCELWFCVKTYNISVINGKAEQVLYDTTAKAKFEVGNSKHPDQYVFSGVSGDTLFPRSGIFAVSGRSLGAMQDFIGSIIKGSFQFAGTSAQFPSDWIEAMWQATTNPHMWIESLGMSLGNEVRNHGEIRTLDALSYQGSASKMTGYAHTQWYWMIYPPAVLSISILYLFGTAWISKIYRVAAWKSDSLPLLFCQVNKSLTELAQDEIGSPKGLARLEKTKVAFTTDSNGNWVLDFYPGGDISES